MLDEVFKGLDAGFRGAEAQNARVVDVVAGEVGQSPASAVFEFLAAGLFRARRKVRMAAAEGLELGPFIDANDLVVRAQWLAVPDA